jgi:hypothetical protein
VQSAGFNGAPVFVVAALWFLNVVAVALIYCCCAGSGRDSFRTYSRTTTGNHFFLFFQFVMGDEPLLGASVAHLLFTFGRVDFVYRVLFYLCDCLVTLFLKLGRKNCLVRGYEICF